jgi:hypothetical protein
VPKNEKEGGDELADAQQITPNGEPIKQEEHAEIVKTKPSPIQENSGKSQSLLSPTPLLEPDCFGVSEE